MANKLNQFQINAIKNSYTREDYKSMYESILNDYSRVSVENDNLKKEIELLRTKLDVLTY